MDCSIIGSQIPAILSHFTRGGRTSSKDHVKNHIPFLGMRKVHRDLQRLNK